MLELKGLSRRYGEVVALAGWWRRAGSRSCAPAASAASRSAWTARRTSGGRGCRACAWSTIGAIGLALAVAVAVAVAVKAITLPAGALGTVGIVLLWFVLGYAFYAGLFAVAGAVVSRQKELQNTSTPLTLVMVASFFVAITSAFGNTSSPLAEVATFLPPTAPLIVPLRMATNAIAAWQVGASLAVMLVSIVAVVMLASRLYAGAILRTGARVKLSDAWRAARQPA